ncbi:zf-CCHC domain-containing protein [Tanacetum coccineum]
MCSKQPNKSYNDQPQDHDIIVEECKTSEEEGKEEKGDPENINTNPPSPPDPSISFITEKVYDSSKEELGEDEITLIGGLEVRYFDIFPTKSELTYHKYLMSGPIPSLFLRNPIIAEGCPSNLKIPCNIGHVHMKKAYINLNSLLNIMTRMQYNWIMRKQLKPGEDPEGIRGIRNFTERIKGMHIFVGNFSYVSNFMIIEDISSIIDPRLCLMRRSFGVHRSFSRRFLDDDLARYRIKNYVRKFLRALHLKWRAKITTIEESKDLSSLALDELIGNLKLRKNSDDETLTSGSDDEEYAMAVRNFKKFFRRKGKFFRQPREENKSFRQRYEKKGKSDRKCFRCGDPNHLIGDCPKPSRNKDQKAFIGGSWSDSENDAKDKTNDETCLMAQSSNKVTLNSSYYSDNASSLENDSMQIEYDSLCEIILKIINKNKILKTKRDLLEKEILELNEKIKKLERSKEIEIAGKSCEELKSENAKLKETQVKFVKFNKSANSLREMLNNQKSPSCKVGLGFDDSKASTSGTKNKSFVGSFAEKATDGSTINVHGSTLPGSVSCTYGEKGT